MPRIARKAMVHRSYGSGHYFHLLTGRDYFGDGFGGDTEAMRQAWQDRRVRDAVHRLLQERRLRGHHQVTPWAEETFE